MGSYIVEFYQKENGEKPVAEFLRSLDRKMAAKVMRDLEFLEDNGPMVREPQSKQLEANLFELRTKFGSNISRVLYFFVVGQRIVVTNGFVKKSEKTPEAEKERARKYRDDYLRRCVK